MNSLLPVNEQYCTFEQSKRLKELGVVQEGALFFYTRSGNFEPSFNIGKGSQQAGYASYNVAELGFLLPGNIPQQDDDYGLVLIQSFPDGKEQEVYMTAYHEVSTDFDTLGSVYEETGKTEAESRANMLIYLLENDIITLS